MNSDSLDTTFSPMARFSKSLMAAVDATERTFEETDNNESNSRDFDLFPTSPTASSSAPPTVSYTPNLPNGGNDGYRHDCWVVALVRRCCIYGTLKRSSVPQRESSNDLEATGLIQHVLSNASDQVRLLSNDDCHDDYNSLDCSETSAMDDAYSERGIETAKNELASEIGECDGDERSHPKFQLSDFERHCILGAGQFGQVWLVSEKKKSLLSDSSSVYALKVHAKYDLIAADEVDTILRERDMMAQLSGHPFIVRIEATFQDENFVFLLQEFCQGGELFSVVHHAVDGILPEPQAAFYSLCIADALHYMHSRGIVYRDLKPENIMLDRLGYPKLIDMGYAKILKHESDYQTFTFCGTPRYLAPETVLSEGSSFGVDHWALGILVYEMVVGESPFYWEGIDEASLFTSIAEEEYPAPPSTVSANVTNLMEGLLIKNSRQRLGSSTQPVSEDIVRHAWFHDLDLAAMRLQAVPAPWIPTLHSVLDTGCFDDWADELEDRVAQKYPLLMRKEHALFAAFG